MAACIEKVPLLQKLRYDKHTKVNPSVPSEAVYVQNFAQGDTWPERL